MEGWGEPWNLADFAMISHWILQTGLRKIAAQNRAVIIIVIDQLIDRLFFVQVDELSSMMYSPAESGYGYSSQAPIVSMDRLNISATDSRDLHARSTGLTSADYSRTDNGYVPGSYGYAAFSHRHYMVSCCYLRSNCIISQITSIMYAVKHFVFIVVLLLC